MHPAPWTLHAKLQPVWVFSTGVANGHEAPPIVNNGVMFVSTPGNQVIAIDAKSGRQLWRYKRPLPPNAIVLHPTSRGVALFDDKVFFAAGEAVLVALNARTNDRKFRAFDARDGKLLWEVPTNSGIIASPSSFMVDGTQYVAVVSGFGIDSRAMNARFNELRPGEFPEVPEGGAVWVFALR